MTTKIEWTERTWNPIAGCTRVSPGCQHCYAERMVKRLAAMGQVKYKGLLDRNDRWNGVMNLASDDQIRKPLEIKKPTMWFTNSMADLFHHELPYQIQAMIFDVMKQADWHTFQVLTKRPENFAKFFKQYGDCPSNVWLGVSVESQRYTDRIQPLLDTSAKVKFLSCEPLLDELNLRDYLGGLHWVIVGGESGPGARPMPEAWVRLIRDDCEAQGVAFFFKQWGGVNKKKAGRLLDGKEYNEMPKVKP